MRFLKTKQNKKKTILFETQGGLLCLRKGWQRRWGRRSESNTLAIWKGANSGCSQGPVPTWETLLQSLGHKQCLPYLRSSFKTLVPLFCFLNLGFFSNLANVKLYWGQADHAHEWSRDVLKRMWWGLESSARFGVPVPPLREMVTVVCRGWWWLEAHGGRISFSKRSWFCKVAMTWTFLKTSHRPKGCCLQAAWNSE